MPARILIVDDEPVVRNLIRDIGRKRTVILSTHILSEVQATCDRVVIINRGTLVADGATESVTARTRGGQLLQVLFAAGTVDPGAAAVKAAVEGLEGVANVRVVSAAEPTHYSFEILADADIRAALFHLAVAQGLDLLELAPERTNLEEVFRRLTVGAPA